MSREGEKTSRLYEGETVPTVETVQLYNPKNGVTDEYQSNQDPYDQEPDVVTLERARQAEELLNSAGWKLIKADIDRGIKDCLIALRETDPKDYGQIARLQAGAKIYENIEGFINRYILEGSIAMDNPQPDSDE